VNEQIQEKRQAVSPGYLEVIAIVLIIVLSTFFIYDRFFAPKVKVIDLKGYMHTNTKMLAAGAINEEQWQRNFDALEQMLREQPSHHLIILKDVVLHHDPDTEIKLR